MDAQAIMTALSRRVSAKKTKADAISPVHRAGGGKLRVMGDSESTFAIHAARLDGNLSVKGVGREMLLTVRGERYCWRRLR